MESRGLRSALRTTLCLAIAVVLHGLLLAIPSGTGRKPSGTMRGIRVRTFAPMPFAPAQPAAMAGRPVPLPQRSVFDAAAPPRSSNATAATGAVADNAIRATSARESGEGGTSASAGGPAGYLGGGEGPGVGEGDVEESGYRIYLRKLRTSEVQQWARQTTREARKEWRGSATEPGGWSGGGKRPGAGRTASGAAAYLDPRVRMVVSSFPPTSIETRHTPVPYPEIRFKKEHYVSGWWNVYFQIWTDGQGKIRKIEKLRPETDGPLERLFVDQVRREIDRWTFDPVAAEIIVDVRFHVE